MLPAFAVAFASVALTSTRALGNSFAYYGGANLHLPMSTAAEPSPQAMVEDAGLSFQERKALHVALSALATEGLERGWELLEGKGQITTTNRIVSSLLVLAVGVAKEVNDHRTAGQPLRDNVRDVGFDLLGVITGNILLVRF